MEVVLQRIADRPLAGAFGELRQAEAAGNRHHHVALRHVFHFLDRFDLDLRGFKISRLEVDGRAAAYRRSGQELIITPRSRLRAGRPFTVRVDYAGVPAVITDPDDMAEAVSAMRHGATAVIEIPPSYAALREEVTRAMQ